MGSCLCYLRKTNVEIETQKVKQLDQCETVGECRGLDSSPDSQALSVVLDSYIRWICQIEPRFSTFISQHSSQGGMAKNYELHQRSKMICPRSISAAVVKGPSERRRYLWLNATAHYTQLSTPARVPHVLPEVLRVILAE